MNLSDAQTALQLRGFDMLSATEQTAMLNNAKNALEDEFQWPWLETTITGTAPLTIADLKYVLLVQDTTNDVELLGTTAAQIAVNGTDLTTSGAPQYWWLDGTGILQTWPTSSAQLTVRYVRFSPELVSATDTPLIPVRYHPVWIDYAVIDGYRDSDNYDSATALLQFVRQFRLPQMMDVYGSRNQQNPQYQTIRAGSDDW